MLMEMNKDTKKKPVKIQYQKSFMRSVTSFKKQSSKEKDVNKKLVAKQPVVL